MDETPAETVGEATATVPAEFKTAADVIARTVANALNDLPERAQFAGLAVVIAFHQADDPSNVLHACGAYTSNPHYPAKAVARTVTKYAQMRELSAPGPAIREATHSGARGLLMHRPHRRRR